MPTAWGQMLPVSNVVHTDIDDFWLVTIGTLFARRRKISAPSPIGVAGKDGCGCTTPQELEALGVGHRGGEGAMLELGVGRREDRLCNGEGAS